MLEVSEQKAIQYFQESKWANGPGKYNMITWQLEPPFRVYEPVNIIMFFSSCMHLYGLVFYPYRPVFLSLKYSVYTKSI